MVCMGTLGLKELVPYIYTAFFRVYHPPAVGL